MKYIINKKLTDTNSLITGGTGYIGRNLIEALKENNASYNILSRGAHGENITKVDYSKRSDIEMAFRTIEKTAKKSIDYIYYLSGENNISEVDNNPYSNILEGINSALNLLEVARSFKSIKKIIILSSASVYGANSIMKKSIESDQILTINFYNFLKLSIENLALLYGIKYNLPVTIVRTSNVYGPNQKIKSIIPEIISQILNKESKNITVRKTSSVRDYIYIDDLISSLLSVVTSHNCNNNIINVGSGVATSISELVNTIKLVFDSPKNFMAINQGMNFLDYLVPDTKKIYELTRWSPKYDLVRGVGSIKSNINLSEIDCG